MGLIARIKAGPTSQKSLTVLDAVQACHIFGFILAAVASQGKNTIIMITVCGLAAMLLHLVGQVISMVTTGCFYWGQNFKPEFPGAFKTVRFLFITLWIFFSSVEACLLAGLVSIAFNFTVGKGLLVAGTVFSALTFFAARYYGISYAVGTGNLKEKEVPELRIPS